MTNYSTDTLVLPEFSPGIHRPQVEELVSKMKYMDTLGQQQLQQQQIFIKLLAYLGSLYTDNLQESSRKKCAKYMRFARGSGCCAG